MRKGLGKGKGSGWKNLKADDPMRHSKSAKGIKNAQKVNINYMRSKYGLETDSGSKYFSLRQKGYSDAEAQAQVFSPSKELAKLKTWELVRDLTRPNPKFSEYYLLRAREELEKRNLGMAKQVMAKIAKTTGMYEQNYGSFDYDKYVRVEQINPKTKMVMVYPNTFIPDDDAKRFINQGVKKGDIVLKKVRPTKNSSLLNVKYQKLRIKQPTKEAMM